MSVPGSCALALLALARDKSGKTQTSGKKKKNKQTRERAALAVFPTHQARSGNPTRKLALTKPQAKRFGKAASGFTSSLPSRSQGFWRSRAQALAGMFSSQSRHLGTLVPQGSMSFPTSAFPWFYMRVCLRAPAYQPGKQLLAQMAFSLPQLFLLGAEASKTSSHSSTRLVAGLRQGCLG